jgi:hypothetical protein
MSVNNILRQMREEGIRSISEQNYRDEGHRKPHDLQRVDFNRTIQNERQWLEDRVNEIIRKGQE